MKNLYYVVEKLLQNSKRGLETTTGHKNIVIYDICTQTFSLIVVGEFETFNENNSEDAVQLWLEQNTEEENFKLIQL